MVASQKVTYRKSVSKKLEGIIAKDFSNAMLITLHCAAPVMISPELAKKIFRGWANQAKRIAGGPFHFIKIIDYGPHPAPEIIFRVVVALPKTCCLRICEAWFMGSAFVKELDSEALIEIADAIMRQTNTTVGEGMRLWSYCGASHRRSLMPLKQ